MFRNDPRQQRLCDSCGMAYASPEEAARSVLREEPARVVGVVARGEQAVVAQVLSADRRPYELSTVLCRREAAGWEVESSDDANMAYLRTSADRCTVVWWGRVPEDAVAARVQLGTNEQTVPAENGYFFSVFDEVPYKEPNRDDLRPPSDTPRFARKGTAGWEDAVEREAARFRSVWGFERPRSEWIRTDR